MRIWFSRGSLKSKVRVSWKSKGINIVQRRSIFLHKIFPWEDKFEKGQLYWRTDKNEPFKTCDNRYRCCRALQCDNPVRQHSLCGRLITNNGHKLRPIHRGIYPNELQAGNRKDCAANMTVLCDNRASVETNRTKWLFICKSI